MHGTLRVLVPWRTSATTLVREMLSRNRYLTSQDIWNEGTAHERPLVQPTQMLDDQGRIRFKKVANIREGRRIWAPPPIVPLPHHPFQSKVFLKSTILTSLEAQNLIHKARVSVPITEADDLLDAERAAARRFRRMRLEAQREHKPLPTVPPAPATTKREYYWSLGPQPPPPPPHMLGTPPRNDTPFEAAEVAAKTDEAGWARAETLEAKLHEARELEKEQIAERKRIRSEKFKAERAAWAAQRDEDFASGRAGSLAQEQRRLDAIRSIEEYAKETGEDVSEWFAEIERANLGTQFPEPIPRTMPEGRSRFQGRVSLTPEPPRRNVNKPKYNKYT